MKLFQCSCGGWYSATEDVNGFHSAPSWWDHSACSRTKAGAKKRMEHQRLIDLEDEDYYNSDNED